MRYLSLLFTLVTLAVSGAAQASASPIPEAPDAAEITQLLKQFLDGASRNDIKMHERFWAEDLVYTSSSGRRRTKDDIRKDIAKENASPQTNNEQTRYTAEDIHVRQYGTTAVLTFELVGETIKDGKTETGHYLNTGTLLKRDGKWQVVAWQATKIPPPEEQKK
jgi:ketosteroid isomerase-like protein